MLAKKLIVTSVSMLLLYGAEYSEATLITFSFSGIVDRVDDPGNVLENRVHIDDSFSGTYPFESNTPDLYTDDPMIGRYYAIVGGLNVTIVDISVVVQDTNARISVVNNFLGLKDAYNVGAAFAFDSADFRTLELGLSLADSSGTVFQSDALPLTPPDLRRFSGRDFNLQGERTGGGDRFMIHGVVKSLVPEPNTWLLLLLSGVLLGVRRARASVSPSLMFCALVFFACGKQVIAEEEPGPNPDYSPLEQVDFGESNQPGNETIDIVFIIDGSGSINPDLTGPFALQKEGIVNCFVGANAFIPHDGTVAIAVIQFSDRTNEEIILTVLDSENTANQLASQVRDITKMGGTTFLSFGLQLAINVFRDEAFGAERIVVVSTDADVIDSEASLQLG